MASVPFEKTSSNRARPASLSAARFVQKLPPSGQDNTSEDSEDIIRRVQKEKRSKPSGTTATASKTPHGLQIDSVPVAAAISFPHEEEESSASLQWGVSVKNRSKRQAATKEPVRAAANSANKASAGLAEEGNQSCPTTSSAPRNSRATGFLDNVSVAKNSPAVLLKTTKTPTDAGVSVTRSGSINEPCPQTALVQITPTSYQHQPTPARAPDKDGISVTVEGKEDCSAGYAYTVKLSECRSGWAN